MAALDELLAGYQRFRTGPYQAQKERFDELVDGQAPKTMVIACSDSRADPATIFDARPGDIFTVRNIGNLVPPFEVGGGRHGVSAALEFAVSALQVESILVMGHGRCGAAQASLTGRYDGMSAGEGHFIAHWVDLLAPARDRIVGECGGRTDRDAERALERAGVQLSLANLRTFPFVAARENAGTLSLHGAYFAIAGGILDVLDEATGTFNPAG